MVAHAADVEAILARRHDNGGDFWATPDGRVYVGNPYSTISSLLMLHELDVSVDHEAVRGALDAVLARWREDGRIRLAPKAPLYPCYTAEAARVLCRFGLAGDERVRRTVSHLLESAHETGGWRCDFSRFGRGPETECANPGATLYVLDVLRFYPERVDEADVVDRAIESLLDHWDVRSPLGPCHWGIGSLFMQVEFPFLRYNLFYYVYVLSHFERARADARFRSALAELSSRLDAEGRIVVERPHRGLKGLAFCEKGAPSAVATRRYLEIGERMES
ncbi:MAG: prenyltransferase [Gemmatimonadota bacterium]